MHYRAGLPGWKLFARVGGTIMVRVDVMKDAEAGVFMARSPDLDGLVVEARTLDELHAEVKHAIHELMDLAMKGQRAHAKTDLHWSDSVHCPA